MLNYKIISIDLDGTLLSSDMHLSERNKIALKKLNDMGVLVVPNSGRSFGEMPKDVKDEPNIRYYISSDGSAVFDKLNNQRIFLGMDKNTFSKAYKILSDYDVFLHFHTNATTYVDEKLFNEKSMREYNLDDYFVKHTLENCLPCKNFSDLVFNAQEIELAASFFKTMQDKKECWRRLEQLGMQVCQTQQYNMEIANPLASKGNGLIELARRLGVPIEKTIAVGDNLNDLDMLSKAGLSIAVDNAHPQVKQKTHLTVCSNDQHVLEYLLDNIIKIVD